AQSVACNEVVDRDVRSRLAAHAQRAEMANLHGKHPSDSPCRLVGNAYWVAALPLQMVRPDIRSRRRVHQLKIYSQPSAVALNVTDNRVLHTEVCHEVRHACLTIAIQA